MRSSRTECHDVMVINHYFTKSLEDWEFKRRVAGGIRWSRTRNRCSLTSRARR